MRRTAPWLLLALAASGCVLDEVPLDGLQCPCAEGWTCDPATDRCVRGDAGAEGMDAGEPDAGPEVDAGAGLDAGPGADAGDVDAAGFDAGPGVDAGPPPVDAGGGLDETVCDELSVAPLFCDGFESGLGAWTRSVVVDGMAVADATMPYRGVAALHAQTMAASGKASVIHEEAAAITSGPLHARAYVYVPSSLTVSGLSFLYVGELAPPNVGIAVQVGASGAAQVYLGTVDRLARGGSRTIFPRDRWVCVTLALTVATNGSIRATVDGTVIADEVGVDTRPASGLAQLIAGIEFTPTTQPSAEIRVDEVVLSTSPIACD